MKIELLEISGMVSALKALRLSYNKELMSDINRTLYAIDGVFSQLNSISFGREVRKIDYFSYQTLRRIVRQRYNHRKAEWHFFINDIRLLPYANELILVGLEDELKIHDDWMKDYSAYRI